MPDHPIVRRLQDGVDLDLLAAFCKDKRCLELGTFYGHSALFMIASGAKSVLTIDNYKNNIPVLDVVENIKERSEVITLGIGDTVEYSSEVEDNSFDLLFIDAGHFYDEVLRDFYAYASKLVKGGIVFFHDYTDLCPGVVKAVDYLAEHLKDRLTPMDIESYNSNIKGFYYDQAKSD